MKEEYNPYETLCDDSDEESSNNPYETVLWKKVQNFYYCMWISIIECDRIHMYSGITSGRVLDGELLYTKILEVNLFAFAYRLFHRDFSLINGAFCRQMQTN